MYFISSPGDGRYGLLKLLNIASDKKFSADDIEFSIPTRNDSSADSRNTKVVVYFKGSKGFYGSKTLYYNRTHISQLPTLDIERNGALTYGAVIDNINSQYNLFITANDIVDGPLPDIVSSLITITLPIASTSYKFYDGVEIATDPFEPDYVLYKSTDTMLGYLCVGFDRWAQYTDDDGNIYQIMVEQNSYDCGYNDVNSRILLTRPATLTLLEEDTSDIFTLEYLNPDADVTVTITSPGLTISQPSFVLTAGSPTGTFTVVSNSPGVFNIAITNDLAITSPTDTTITFIDRYNTTYGVEPPALNKVIKGIPTADFTITGYMIDPDEDVTVTIHTQNELVASETSVLLTVAEPEAVFTVVAANQGTYGLTFTNNRNLSNPSLISINVLNPGNITLTPPATGIANGIQSDVFTVTLVDGLEAITVTPSFTGAAVVTPGSFVLTPGSPTGTFRVTYAATGAQTLTITNSGFATNPANYNFTVLTKPTLLITAPTEPINSSQTSDAFTITLVNGYKSVTVNLSSNVTTLSTSSVVLTPASPSATFTVRANTGGSYFVSFSNNGGLVNPGNEIIEILQVYNTSYLATAPVSTNLIINQASNSFTVTATDINPAEPITVSIATSANLTANKTEVVLTSASPSNTFTVVSDTEGSYTVTLTNNRGLTNPSPFNVSVIDPGYLTLDVPAGDKFVNQNSDNFTVTLVNGYQPITVSLVSSGATFIPTTLSLSEADTIKTFTVRYGTSGNKTISLTNNALTVNPAPVVVTINKVPSIVVTPPSNPTYQNFESDNFTVTLIDGYKTVTVLINSTTDTVSPSSVVLTPAEPVATFTVTEASAGNFSVSFTNSENYTITNSLNFTVNEFTAPVLSLTGPTSPIFVGEDSANFTISIVNPVEAVAITVNTNADNVTPSVINLSPATPSVTFTVRFDTVTSGYVGITNDRGLANPVDITFDVTVRPPVVLSLSRVTVGDIYRSIQQTFKVDIADPVNTTLITPTYSGGTGTIGGAFNLSPSLLTNNFAFTPADAGEYVVSINNNRSIDNPTPITITVLNGELLFRTPATSLSAILESDWFEVEMVNYNQITIIDLVLTGSGDTSVYIDPTDVYQTSRILLTNNNRIGRFKLTKPTAGVFTIGIANNKSLINPANVELTFYAPPQLLLVEPAVTTSFLNSAIGDYTVTLVNYVEEITARPYQDKLINDANKANVVLFLDFQGTNGSFDHSDNSPKNYTIQTIASGGSSGIALSNIDPINGFTSALFLNSEDYLAVTELDNDFRFTADFTIEIDFKTSSVGKMLLDMNSASGAYWYLWINLSGQIEWRSSVSVTPISSVDTVNTNTPQRVAVSRNAGVLRLFLNGSIVGSFTNSGTYDSTSPTLYIGAQGNVRDIARDFIGYISQVKITNGTGRYSTNYTPVPLKVIRFIPEFLVLNNVVTSSTFEVEASAASDYTFSVIGEPQLVNAAPVSLTFELTPSILFTPADGPFYFGEESASFSIQLVDASSDVEITVTKDPNLSFLETPVNLVGNTFTLNGITPSTTFTLIASTIGTYSFVLTNNKGLVNPESFSYVAGERTNNVLSLNPPEVLSLEINSVSDAFTVNLLGTEIQDITVTPESSPGLTINPTSFVLNQSNKVATFTVTTSVLGDYVIGFSSSPVIPILDPTTATITFTEQAALVVTDQPALISSGIESGNFEVTLVNPLLDTLVTPVVENGVAVPESFTLTAAEPVATFTILFSSYGYKSLTFNTSPILSIIDSKILVVEPQVLPSDITLDVPNDLFINLESSNFLLTLNDGPWEYDSITGLIVLQTVDNEYTTVDNDVAIDSAFVPKDVGVTVTSAATGFSKTSFNLNASSNTDTFTLNSSVGGTFTITVNNDSGVTNPAPTDIDVGDQLQITVVAPIKPFYKSKNSWPFTASIDFLDREVIVTPISSDANAIFIPEFLTLTPGNNSGTFRIKSSEVGTISVSTINDSGFLDSPNLNITIIDIDEFYEYTELHVVPPVSLPINNISYNQIPFINATGTLDNGVNAFYPNDPTRPVFNNSDTISISSANNSYFGFKDEFCFEFLLRYEQTTNSYSLLHANSQSINDSGFAITLDLLNRKIILNNRFSPSNIVFETAPNSLPPTKTYFYLVFECFDDILKIYVDSGTGTVLIGETSFKMPDHSTNKILYIFGNSTLAGYGVNTSTLSTKVETIRLTSKARYNGNMLSMSDFTNRFVTIGAPSIRVFKPSSSYVDKNVLSENITIKAFNFVDSITVTPQTNTGAIFYPTNAILTTESPSATFKFISNVSGVFPITFINDSYIDILDSFNLTVLEPDPLYDDVIFLFQPIGNINDPVNTTTVKDFSKYVRTTNSTSGFDTRYALKSNFSKFDVAIDNLNNAQVGYYFTLNDDSFNLAGVDFTIEGSCYFNKNFEAVSEITILCATRTSNLAPNEGFRIIVKPLARKFLIAVESNTTFLIPEESTPGTLPGENINFDFAIEYVSGILTIYINGEIYVSATVTFPPKINLSGQFRVGLSSGGTNQFNGGIDQIRITKNNYRYGSPYSCPVLPFSKTGAISFNVTPPTVLKYFDTEISEPFVVTASNIKDTCVVTFISDNPGIVFTPNFLELTPSILSSSFNVHGTPGTYEITFSNNLLLENNQSFIITIYDDTLTTVSSVLTSRNFVFNDETILVPVTLNNPVIGVDVTIALDPLQDDPHRDNVVLMLDFQGQDGDRSLIEHSIYDYDIRFNGSGIALEEDNAIQGKTSLYIPGFDTPNTNTNNLSISAPSSNPSALNNFKFDGDFTVEIRYRTFLSTASKTLLRFGLSSGAYFEISFDSSQRPRWIDSVSGNTNLNIINYTPGPVYDFAVSRIGSNLYFFINGSLINTIASSGNIAPTENSLIIGSNYDAGSSANFNGYIAYVKITKGVGRYDSNYSLENYNYPIFTPNKISLDSVTPNNQFDVTSSFNKEYDIIFFNNKNLVTPDKLRIGFFNKSSINLNLPSSLLIGQNDISDIYSLSITNPSKSDVNISFVLPNEITLYSYSPTEAFVGGTQFNLNEEYSIVIFRFISTIEGVFPISFINDRGLVNPVSFNVTVKIPEISIIGPNPLNEIYINENSFDLSLSIDAVYSPISVIITLTSGISFSDLAPEIKTREIIFDYTTSLYLFKITSTVTGLTEQITITNDKEAINPAILVINTVNRPTIPNSLQTTDYTLYLVGEDTDNKDINLFQGFF